MKITKYITLFIVASLCISCGFYSLSGANTGEAKTFQVNYFQNNAILIEPGLDRDFTIALQDLILNQTNLELVTSNGDLVYEGEITEYRISPTTATSNNTAAQNKVTMTVKVSFINKTKEENNFDKSFSFFYNFDGNAQLSGSTKVTAFEELFDRITQDIFNASLADW
jgi:hypothetical protein